MATRSVALVLGKVAGYHNDTRTFVRALVESRVSRSAMNQAWAAGVRAKAAGVRCDCFACKRERGEV